MVLGADLIWHTLNLQNILRGKKNVYNKGKMCKLPYIDDIVDGIVKLTNKLKIKFV